MKAAIIGAGFVGLELARQLLAAGHEVWLLGTSCPAEGNMPFQPLDVIKEDIRLPEGVEAVFYLAQSPYYRDFPRRAGHLFGVNAWGAVKAAEAAAEMGCRFFFYASTGNVYAPSFSPLAENGPLARQSAYALSKIQAEEALFCLARPPMSVLCGRIFGVFGRGQKNMLPAAIFEKVTRGEPVVLHSSPQDKNDGGGLRVSFIYNRDLAVLLVRLAEKAMAGGRLPWALNLAGASGCSIKGLALAIGEALGKKPRFEGASQPRAYDLVADVSLLKTCIPPDFTPFQEAVRQSFAAGAGL